MILGKNFQNQKISVRVSKFLRNFYFKGTLKENDRMLNALNEAEQKNRELNEKIYEINTTMGQENQKKHQEFMK